MSGVPDPKLQLKEAVLNLKSRPAAFIGTLILGAFLSGCIQVENFGTAWDEATIDPALEGHWKATAEHPVNNAYLTFTKRGDAYDLESATASFPDERRTTFPAIRSRTLKVGGHSFLLIYTRQNMEYLESLQPNLRKGGMLDGGIQLYTLVDGELRLQALKDNRLEQAIVAGNVGGTIPDRQQGMASLRSLDSQTLRFLSSLADEPDAWIPAQYTRVKDIQESLRQSRSYPAGPQTSASTTIRVQLPGFQLLCSEGGDVLRRQLQASPEWQVFQEGQDDIVACRRILRDGIWTETSNGYWSTFGGSLLQAGRVEGADESDRYQIRYLFRFNRVPTDKSSIPSEIPGFAFDFKQASPVDGDVQLNLKKDDQGIESYFAVGGGGVWFEFFEQSSKEDRAKTREAISWLDQFSRELVAARESIAKDGHAAGLMPSGAVTRGNPSVRFDNNAISAHLNPGRQGFVHLRVYDAVKNLVLDSSITDWGGKEYVGWSADRKTLFPYRKNIRIPDELTKPGSIIRVELWFRPTDGTPGPRWWAETDPADVKLLDCTKEY